MESIGSRHLFCLLKRARSRTSCLYVGATTRIAAARQSVCTTLPYTLVLGHATYMLSTFLPPCSQSVVVEEIPIEVPPITVALLLIISKPPYSQRRPPPTRLVFALQSYRTTDALPDTTLHTLDRTLLICSFAIAASTHFDTPPTNTHALYPTISQFQSTPS